MIALYTPVKRRKKALIYIVTKNSKTRGAKKIAIDINVLIEKASIRILGKKGLLRLLDVKYRRI